MTAPNYLAQQGWSYQACEQSVEFVAVCRGLLEGRRRHARFRGRAGFVRAGPDRAAHRLCVCRDPDAVGCAEQQEGGSRARPRRVSPGLGRAPPVRVSRP